MTEGKYITNTSIKSWSEEDRPREKLQLQGKSALSDAELLAILLSTGTIGINAIQLSEDILSSVSGNISELGRRSIKELMKFKGIGEAKAITIVAALELGRRRQMSDIAQRSVITCARDVYETLLPQLIDLPYEEFWILLLNNSNNIINKHKISVGGVTATVVDAKLVFKPAIEALATSIILVHNHPSGKLEPSKQDIDLTRKLKEAGKSLDIAILDHVIISHSGFYSFADNGIF
jgi:DNA repair protein RadC